MTLVLLVLTVWFGLSAGATLVMAGICKSGHLEDEARGYVPGAASIPAPRSASHDRSHVDA